MLGLSKATGSAALLVAFLLIIASVVATAQGRLVITLDGKDGEWNVSGWVCPGEHPCQVPTTVHTAWLCCNTTRTPRECQLVWYDDGTGLVYVRFYLNRTGLYAYVLTDYHFIKSRVNITLTVREYTLNITIGTGFNSARYRLFKGRSLIACGNLSRPGDFTFNNTRPGERVRGIEVAFRFSAIEDRFAPQPSDEYALKVVIMRDGAVSDESGVCEGGACTDVVRLIVVDYKIHDSYYIAGGRPYPVPIPEPGALVSVVALATALGAIAFAASGRRT